MSGGGIDAVSRYSCSIGTLEWAPMIERNTIWSILFKSFVSFCVSFCHISLLHKIPFINHACLSWWPISTLLRQLQTVMVSQSDQQMSSEFLQQLYFSTGAFSTIKFFQQPGSLKNKNVEELSFYSFIEPVMYFFV